MKVKAIIFVLCIFFFVSSCTIKQVSLNHNIQPDIIRFVKLIESNQLDEIVLFDLNAKEKERILAEFTRPIHEIAQLDKGLNQGYFLLLEDISKSKYPCIAEKRLAEKYMSTDWETRNIGFRNWITRLKGATLLQEAKNLKYEILIIKLLDNNDLIPLIDQREVLLKQLLDTIQEYKLVD